MKNAIAPAFIGLLLLITPSPAQDAKPDTLNTLEKKLLGGTWHGPACGGDCTFKADGTFTMVNFTPGQNTLTGTWSIRWDALPPTLIITAKTSDFKTRAHGKEYELLNKPQEFKLVELNDKAISYRSPDGKLEITFTRSRDDGGYTKPVK